MAETGSVHATRFEAAVKVIQSLPKNGESGPGAAGASLVTPRGRDGAVGISRRWPCAYRAPPARRNAGLGLPSSPQKFLLKEGSCGRGLCLRKP